MSREFSSEQRDEVLVADGFWEKFRAVARRLPFAEDLLTAYYTAIDPRTPQAVRAALFAALAYFVVPTDLIPDFVVGLGYTDDAAVLAAALKTLAAHIRPRHRAQARQALIVRS
ncbi:MAG: YkvA family protein [Pseudomonadales bacterium]